jgi:hypothetical protein
LRDLQALVDVADTDLSIEEQAENTKPRGVGQRLEEELELRELLVHIYVLTNIPWPGYRPIYSLKRIYRRQGCLRFKRRFERNTVQSREK